MKQLNIIFFGMDRFYSINSLLSIAQHHKIIAIVEAISKTHKQTGEGKHNIFNSIYYNLRNKYSLKDVANKLNVQYFRVGNVNNLEMENKFKELKPDLICVCSFNQLIKKNITDIPKHGIINLHPSFLPNYRGPDPYIWIYHNQEKFGGVTIHYIDEGADTGPIIYQEKFKIGLGQPLNETINRAINIGTKLMIKAINDIAKGDVKKINQVEVKGMTKAISVDNIDTLVDWESWDVKKVYHFTKGLNKEYNIIKCNKKYKKILILNYEEIYISKQYKKGNIYNDKNGHWICCNNGRVYIKYKFDIKKIIKTFLNTLNNIIK